MPGLCKVCSQRTEYLEFCKLAVDLNVCLGVERPGSVSPGGRAFLGRHYAHNRSILFTLNPRPNPSQSFSARLLSNNRHWEGEAKARFRNWTFARHLFRSMAASAEWVCPSISDMTDQFIVPWPSRDWYSMESSLAWPAIREYSAELCRLSLRHHRPRLVFVSGKTTLRLLFEFIGAPRPKPTARRVPRNKSWTCEWYELEHGDFSSTPGSPMNIVRLPHFSRAGYTEFEAVGGWVAQVLAGAIPAGGVGSGVVRR